jgi:hypothetical protein
MALGIGVAAVVVFAGLRATEGDPELPEGAGVTASPAPLVSPKRFYAEIRKPSDGSAFPARIRIGPEEHIPYDPEVLFGRIKSSPSGYLWLISYDSDSNDSLVSTLAIEAGGRIQTQDILPWDGEIFQPLLDYAGVPLQVRTNVTSQPGPAATPAPTPTKVLIRGVEVIVPAGVAMSRVSDSSHNRHIASRDGIPLLALDDCGIDWSTIPTGDTEMIRLLDDLNALTWEPLSTCGSR